jgi:undecaprenyl-diphosphatase
MADARGSSEEQRVKRGLLRIIPLSLLIAVACLFLFSWIAEEMLEQDTRHFDGYLRNAVHHVALPNLTSFMAAITNMGSWMALGPVGVVVLWVLLARKKHREAVLLIVTVAGGLVLDGALKLGFHRTRPQPFFGIPVPKTYSFPCGHALGSFCFYGVLAWIATRYVANRQRRTLVWTAAVVLIGLIGLSRIYLGVHYPSDVIAGYAAAAVWVTAVELVGQRWRIGKSNAGL